MTLAPLFFDLDHTLWDFETNSRLALEQGFKDLDLGSLGWPICPRGSDITRRPTTIVGPNSGPAGWTKPPCVAGGLNWRWRLVVRRALRACLVKWGSITWPTAPTKDPHPRHVGGS